MTVLRELVEFKKVAGVGALQGVYDVLEHISKLARSSPPWECQTPEELLQTGAF